VAIERLIGINVEVYATNECVKDFFWDWQIGEELHTYSQVFLDYTHDAKNKKE
jgi:hypothetical protein